MYHVCLVNETEDVVLIAQRLGDLQMRPMLSVHSGCFVVGVRLQL